MDFTQQLDQAFQLLSREDFRGSAQIFQDVLAKNPNQHFALVGMGLIAMNVENLEAAEDYLKRAVKSSGRNYAAWIELGNVYTRLRKPQKAIEAFQGAVKLDPGKSQGHLKLGHVWLITGDKDKAVKSLKKAFLLDSDSPEAFTHLASAMDIGPSDRLAEEAGKRLNAADISDKAAADLHFGLAYIHERAGDDGKFMEHLHEANRRQNIGAADWRPVFGRNVEAIHQLFTARTFDQAVDERSKRFTPVFIVGLPRSGTTLTEQIIAAHPDVYGADEVDYMTKFIVNGAAVMTGKPYLEGINDLTREQLEQLSQSYQARMQRLAPGKAFITDKYLSNFLSIGLIRKILPWAKVIALSRNPMDNALSIYRNAFLPFISFCNNLEDMGEFYHIYRQMMKKWDSLLPGFVCHVEYETLVKDFESEARRIIEFCGLEWDDACLAPEASRRSVMTLSHDQVRKPVYASSVGKWKKYREDLAPFRTVIEKYGYQVED